MIPTIKIDSEKCLRCGLCLKDCFARLLAFGADGLPAYIPGGAERCFHCQHCMSVCPAGALSWSGKKPEDAASPGRIPDSDQMLNLLRQRRSIRAFRRENASPETFSALKNTMAFVPTGCNDHRLFFAYADDLTVTDSFRETARKRVLEKILAGTLPASIAHFANMRAALEAGTDVYFRGAPHFAAISVPPDAKDAHIDPYIAASQFELFAQTLGLGTCWGGMATDLFQADPVLRGHLLLPEGSELKIVMLFGIPAVKYARAPQPEPCPSVSLKKI